MKHAFCKDDNKPHLLSVSRVFLSSNSVLSVFSGDLKNLSYSFPLWFAEENSFQSYF